MAKRYVRANTSAVKRVSRRLKVLGEAINEAVISELEDSASEIVAEQKRRAPFETGVLRNSIRKGNVRQNSKGASVTVRAGGPATHDSSTTRPGGFNYAFEQEFGNQNMPANPFFYPVIREKAPEIRKRIRRIFQKEVRK